jgi:periplasmic protein TonB
MNTRRFVALVSISVAVHAALVLAIGNILTRPESMPEPIEVELAHGRQPVSSSAEEFSPNPDQHPQEPPPVVASAAEPIAQPTAKPAKQRPQPQPSPKRAADTAPAHQLTKTPTVTTLPDTASAKPAAEAPPEATESGSIAHSSVNSSAENANAAPQARDASILQAWLAAVRARIESAKRYPYAAEQRSIQGVLMLQFRLSPDGRLLGAPVISKSSGFSILDNAALRAVDDAAPFPRFPGPARDMPAGPLSVELTFTLR